MKRFWDKVDKSGYCWEWLAYKDKEGYGQFQIGHKSFKAHRISYLLSIGPITEDMFICHHCDNPGCVRPSHLFMGTQTDNMRDAIVKGRVNVLGINNGRSKLTERDIYEIRRICSFGIEQKLVSKMWLISPSHVCRIVNRKKWNHI